MSMFFLTPEQQAAKDAEEARQAAELRAIQEAARSNISYAPTEIRTSDVGAYKTSEQLAAEVAELEAKQNQAKEQVIAEQGDIYASTVGTGGSFAERQEERAEREEIYFNEQRTGMASQGSLDAQAFTASPFDLIDDSLKPTSYFDEDNQAKGDERLYDEIKEDFVSGETSGPQDINIYIGEQEGYKNLIYDFDYGEDYSGLSPAEQRLARTDGTIDYSRPVDFQNAKDSADSYYVQSLERSLENATTDEEKQSIQKLIDKGAPNFDTLKDIQNYDNLAANHKFESENGFDLKHEEYKALALQEAVMGDYMIGAQREELGNKAASYFKEDPAANLEFEAFKGGDVFFNTGTAFNHIPASNLVEENGTVGQVGEFSYIAPVYLEQSPFEKTMNIVLDVASVLYPPIAPVIQGGKVATSGGDLEDVIKTAAKTWAGNEVSDIAFDDVLQTFDDIGIPLDKLSEVQQKIIVDTTLDGLAGKSVEESFKKNAGDAIVAGVGDTVGGVLSDIGNQIGEIETPEWLEKAGDVVVATGQAVGDFIEPIVKPVYEGVKAVGDVVEEAVQPISDFTSDVEDDILDAGRAFDDTVIDPIDDVVDTFGEEVVDPVLQTVGEVGQDIIDPIDDIIDAVDSPLGDLVEAGGDLLGGMLGGQGQQQQRTATESLFDKELFKFDTEIKSTQRMLSPTNRRRYG